ncbi:MAG TPA: cytochrome c [Longimicrobiales bacterium]|nr:cytochrome c [Longimicrobiales bacterium]
MRWPALLFGVVFIAASSACQQEFEPPDRGERVDRAAARYTSDLFDSVTWVADDVRLTVGNEVYAGRCRRCHGTLGLGETDYARERRLTVPSLVASEWPYADLDSLRRKIFVGHESGMPIYGDGELTHREIDATAAYILLTLRPDVLLEDHS